MDERESVLKKRRNRRSVSLAIIVTLILAAVLFTKGYLLREKNLELRRKQAAVASQIAEEQEKNDELKQKKSRGYTEEELFEIARQRFGLVFKNEILLIPEDE